MGIQEFQVIGRAKPTEANPTPKIFRMRLFAPDDVRARSRFWYFLGRVERLKKTNGEVLACNQIFEKKPEKVKNFVVWLTYQSRSGIHNCAKEYRDTTRCGAVDQMYMDFASRHRARFRTIHIRDVVEVAPSQCKRTAVTQFHDSKLKFPLPHRLQRAPSRQRRSRFLASRPNTYF
eukprot:CAMPEP_0201503150 /NCGR_PEP_ID=MMETSP0151_2-20130828/84509_1 /ASSEMBLY_ACC=CAM_ASM_000257 /TAXON_ID=200890 /ORGANISM="Paramoeba atlantica, Strain 621/1 / CCAP 1560/9" /LENGTH=175 /DNA_ID=CAMNT_0047896787 /DNA_START=469 /DNA_END=996 /DNA_ORIENTATION=-